MTSTRDINSKANYCLEQRAQEMIRSNLAFYNGPNGHAYDPAYPELYTQGYMPSDNFSFNPIDIESSLFGMGSCNLVDPKPPTIPQFKPLQTISFFQKPTVVRSKPFWPISDQRPFICNI